MDNSVLKFPDLLRVEGVMAKGFGIICKFPMLDPDLNLAAKAIYALLCSYAGNGDTAFPSRDKMMGLLQIGKDKYYSGLKQLTTQGYVTVEKRQAANGHFDSNIYTIVSNPKKFILAKRQDSAEEGELTFGFTGIKSDGYGMIPRMVIFDTRLTCTAKVIYAYLASYSGSGKVAFPKIKDILYHLGLSKTTFGTHMDKLIALNYVTREQRRIKGRLATNNYRLNDCPDEAVAQPKRHPPRPKKPDTVKPDMVDPDTVRPDMVKPDMAGSDTVGSDTVRPDTVKPDIKYQDTTNTSSFKNSSSKISPSIISAGQLNWMDGLNREELVEIIEDCWEIPLYTPEVRKEYGITLSDDSIQYMIDLVVGFILSEDKTLTANGRRYTKADAVDRFCKLSLDDLQHTFERVACLSGRIKNKRKYILACLLTIKEDVELEAELEVKKDLGNLG